jgi:amino acid permease
MMTLFEGNQQILNLYAEADQPESFFMISVICIVVLTLFIAATIGYLGYLAFGASTKSVILLNLPNEDPLSVAAKICYVLTIMGSFVIIINPVYRVIENSTWYKRCAGTEQPSEAPKETLTDNGNKSLNNDSVNAPKKNDPA